MRQLGRHRIHYTGVSCAAARWDSLSWAGGRANTQRIQESADLRYDGHRAASLYKDDCRGYLSAGASVNGRREIFGKVS